ncbi:ABC transporter substrate-binding protein [Proteiniclasticum ruminis]|uniref:ABC transporter substrate-binding protein n=1 Tax=Proteiniclasticum ruminis TaxID=398199 RepID=UPI0028AF305B|nr:ABC transporter substrate-binding protein [Proteiniclasticum ruminis]
MKKIIALTMAVMMSLAVAACGAKEETPGSGGKDDDVIKIGLTTVLTGDRSLEGQYATNAAKIIEQEINDAGGVLGKKIQIVIEDALGTDVGAVNAHKKLASDPDIVAVIGTDSSNDNIAMSASALEAKIPTTGQGSSPTLTKIANEENPYLFQLRASDQTLCAALIKYAVEEKGVKSFAILNDTETASSDQAKLFKEALATYGIVPTVEVPFTTGTKDFSSHLAKVKDSGAEGIIIASFHTEGAIFLQQKQALGMEQPVFGSNAFGDPVTIELAGEAINGVFSVTAWVPNTTNEKGAAFSKKYTDLYDEACAKTAAQIYDHVSVLVEGIKRAGSTDREAVREALTTIDAYQGAITMYDLRTNGDCGRGGLIVEVVDGVPTIIQELYNAKDL